MKKEIHPQVHEVTASCVCGAQFKTYSTKPELRVDICAKCHPFFTGNEKIMDTEGRVERFKRQYKMK